MKKYLLWLGKAAAAGALAMVLMSAFSLVYYYPGVHVTNPSGATDYLWVNAFASDMTEGFGWNRVDRNGFLNPSDMDPGMDILVMGSSHMEGTHLRASENLPALLAEALDCGVYNIGTSGHRLPTCVQNLSAALETFAPTGWVILETQEAYFSPEEIEQCVTGRFPELPSYDSGLLYHMQKIPCLKLFYYQLQFLTKAPAGKAAAPAQEPNAPAPEPDREDYDRLAACIAETCEAYGVKPLIVYHVRLHLSDDGSAAPGPEEKGLALLAQSCRDRGIVFVNMTGDFVEMYERERVLPHGFSNTAVGVGHLNAHGNRAIAARLAEIIAQEDGK